MEKRKMNSDEHKSREELKQEYEDFKVRQSDRDATYEEKLQKGKASGFDKFCHVINKFLGGCIDSLGKRL